jgi:predicted RecA/RadA family phage recombinase
LDFNLSFRFIPTQDLDSGLALLVGSVLTGSANVTRSGVATDTATEMVVAELATDITEEVFRGTMATARI